MRLSVRSILVSLLVISMPYILRAQLPQDLPHDSDPVDFTDPVNIVLYVGVPLLLIILYIVWRRRFRKE